MSGEFDAYHKWLGIPPDEQPPNYYRLLGITRFESDADVIANAADRQMSHVKSFQIGPQAHISQHLLSQIATAKTSLLNPTKKAAYDARLRADGAGQAMPLGTARPMTARSSGAANAQAVAASEAVEAAPAEAEPTEEAVPEFEPAPRPRHKKSPKKKSYAPLLAFVFILSLCGVLAWLVSNRTHGGAAPAHTASGGSKAGGGTSSRDDTESGEGTGKAGNSRKSSDMSPTGATLLQLRTALAERQMTTARQQLAALEKASQNAVQKAEVARLKIITNLLDDFWKAVQGTGQKLEPGDEITLDGEMLGVASAADKTQVTIKVGPSVSTFAWQDLPANLALALARQRLETDTPRNAAIFGAFHAMDAAGDRQRARDLWQRASGPGIDSALLLTELDVPLPDNLKAAPKLLASTVKSNMPPPTESKPERPIKRPVKPKVGNPADTAGKTPIPAEGKQNEARKLIEDVFKNDLAAAKKAAEKAELAKKLFKQATETQGDAAGQFVLYGMARDLAADGGETMTAIQAVDALAKTFAIDALEMKAAALERVGQGGKGGQASKTAVVDVALPLIEQAAEAERFDVAKRLGKAALEAATANKEIVRAKQIRARGRELVALQKQFNETQVALIVLQEKADDPAANQTAGRWYCFTKGDWPKGLPYLAKSDDPALSDLAKQEMAEPADPAGQEKLADAWWTMGDKEEESPTKTQALRRARYWYEQVLPNLSGLAKAKVEKRMASLPSVEEPSRPQELPLVVGEIKRFAGFFRKGANGIVTSDGSRVLLISDRVIRLVDLVTGEDRVRFEGHQAEVYDARLSWDCKRVVSQGKDDTLRVWNAVTGAEIHNFKLATEGEGFNMVVSRDGKKVVFSTGGQHVIRIWDLEAGKELQRFSIGDGEHWVNAISLDGKRALAGGFHNGVHIWDVLAGKKIADFDGHVHTYCAIFSPDAKFAFVGGGHDIRYFRLQDKREMMRMSSDAGDVYSFTYSPDGKRALSGNGDGSVVLWDLVNNRDLQQFRGHQVGVKGLSFTPDGRRALSSDERGVIILWGLPQ